MKKLITFQELSLTGTLENLRNFFQELTEVLTKSNWTRKREYEKDSARVYSSSDMIYFESEDFTDIPQANVILHSNKERTEYRVSNIIPMKTGKLSYEEYNAILNRFHDNFVKPLAKKFEITIVLSDPEFTLLKYISQENFKKLELFSMSANKSTGSSHHRDRERWFDFILSIHRKGEKLNADILQRWLVEEEKWATDEAIELAIEYEFGLSLLQYNDENVAKKL